MRIMAPPIADCSHPGDFTRTEAFRNRPAVDPRTLMVATLHAPAGLVKKAGPGRTPIFLAARDRRTQIPEERAGIGHGGPAVPDHIGRCEGGGYLVAALSVWLLAWALLFHLGQRALTPPSP
jgi:hypothetical protein